MSHGEETFYNVEIFVVLVLQIIGKVNNFKVFEKPGRLIKI